MRTLEFDEFRIDLDSMVMYRNDRLVPIGQKTLDALLFLIENRNQVVAHETLRRYVWKSEGISSSTIPMCMTEIRKALSDDASSPRYIASVKGKGYRFIANIHLHSDRPHASDPGFDFPFVGRQGELDAFKRVVRATTTSLSGRFVCIIGEAGVGKSRLVSELAYRFSHQADVVFAKTTSIDVEFAYSIWTRALRVCLMKFPGNVALMKSANAISAVLPEVSLQRKADMGTRPVGRVEFLREWCTAFKSISSYRPLIVVLEDLHQADPDSIFLLEQLAVETAAFPIILLATARPSIAKRDDLKSVRLAWESGDATVLQLRPLSLDEVTSLIDPFAPDRATIATEIFHRTAGNAFYATHLIRLWSEQDPISRTSSGMGNLTESGADIVSKQLSDLPRSTREILSIASVIGARFSVPLLASALDLSPLEVIERLDPARTARIIRGPESDVEFSHSLLRDLLYQLMSPQSKMAAHARIAEILYQSSSDRSVDAVRYAHLLHSFPLVTAEVVCTAGLAAGSDAMVRFAYNEASRLLRTAHDVAEKHLAEEDPTRFDLMLALANASLYSGDRAGAKHLLLEAARLSRRAQSPDRLALCGLAIAPDFLSIEVGSYDPEMVMILSEALEHLPPGARSLRARVMARLSQIKHWDCSSSSEAENMARSALDTARQCEDPKALISALAACADASHGPDRTDQRIRLITELQAATLTMSDIYSFLLQQTRLIAALLEEGNIRRVLIENNRYRDVAERTGLPQYRWYPASTDSMLACMVGDYTKADQIAEQSRILAGGSPDENFVQTFACQAILRAIERNESERVLSLVEEFASKQNAVYSWAAAVAWIQWDAGREIAARETLRQFSRSDILKLYREPGGTIGLAALAETCAYVGSKSMAEILYPLVSPVSIRCATAGYGVAYFGTLARYAGLLAIALRDFESARRLTRFAIRAENSRQARSWAVYSTLDYCRAVQESLVIDRSRDVSRIRSLSERLSLPLPRARRCIGEALSLGIDQHNTGSIIY